MFQALDLIFSIADDTSKLTVDLILELHSVCMKTCNILPVRKALIDTAPGRQSHYTETQAQTSEFGLRYTNVKLTRQATRKNVVIAGPPRVQFCPFEDIITELGRFVHLARVCHTTEFSFLPTIRGELN
jgi:hypothetical protein